MRFAKALYRTILRGSDAELAVVADELARSSRSLVEICATHVERQQRAGTPGSIAYDIILMIANRKFCRHIVESAQLTAIRLCEDITHLGRYEVPIGPFSAAVTIEAIDNLDSILYHETGDFASDLIGNIRPWTKAIYGDYRMIRSMGIASPLGIRVWSSDLDWRVAKWRGFTRVVLASIEGYAAAEHRGNGFDPIGNAVTNLQRLTSRLPQVSADSGVFFDSDDYKKLRLSVSFLEDAMRTIEIAETPITGKTRVREEFPQDIFQRLAELGYEILMSSCQVKGTRELTWEIQYGSTWSRIFQRFGQPTRTARIVQARLTRLFYKAITELEQYGPNYVGARVVGLVLNVAGLSTTPRGMQLRCVRAIFKIASRWARRHYLTLRREYPEVAQALLVGSLDFDVNSQRIRKRYASVLGRDGQCEYLELDPPTTAPPNW